MTRFDSLEFDDHPKAGAEQRAAASGTPIRDAAYFRSAADRQFMAGNLEAALQNYAKALEQNKAEFPCWLGQVRALIELGEYREANIWADKALELFPEHPELLAAKAVAACRMGMLDKAMAYSDNAASGANVTPYVWIARAEVLLHRKSKMAAHCLQQALIGCDGHQSHGRLHLDISRMLRFYRRYSQALEYASQAVQAMPRESAAWAELGLCQSSLGLRDATTSFEQALQLNPDSSLAKTGMKSMRGRGFGGRIRGFFRRLVGR